MVRIKQGEFVKNPLSRDVDLFHRAHRRFIVLKHNCIEWYENEEKARRGSPLGCLGLPPGTQRPELDDSKRLTVHAKDLLTPKWHTLVLIELEQGEAAEWKEAIEQVLAASTTEIDTEAGAEAFAIGPASAIEDACECIRDSICSISCTRVGQSLSMLSSRSLSLS